MMKRANPLSLPLAAIFAASIFSTALNAHAIEATISLKSYEYREMVLLRVARVKDGKMIACFYGAHKNDKGEFLWVSEHSEIGARISSVRQIFQDHVVIEETIAVNGVDWVLAEFTWPVATDPYSKSLVVGCGEPPYS